MFETDVLVHEGRITENAILEGPGPTMTLLAVQVLFFPFLFMPLTQKYVTGICQASSGVQTNIHIAEMLSGKENRYCTV
jgi:hypothetical protein